jgi:hypothetical protein
MLKAAPGFSTYLRLKNPGITGMLFPIRRFVANSFVSLSSKKEAKAVAMNVFLNSFSGF